MIRVGLGMVDSMQRKIGGKWANEIDSEGQKFFLQFWKLGFHIQQILQFLAGRVSRCGCAVKTACSAGEFIFPGDTRLRPK